MPCRCPSDDLEFGEESIHLPETVVEHTWAVGKKTKKPPMASYSHEEAKPKRSGYRPSQKKSMFRGIVGGFKSASNLVDLPDWSQEISISLSSGEWRPTVTAPGPAREIHLL